MTGPTDPDATRPFNEGGDATTPMSGADETRTAYQVPAGPGPGGPEGPDDDGPWDDSADDRRKLWWYAAGALALGLIVGGLIAAFATGGDDKPEATTTSSSSTTTSSSSTTTTTVAPTTTTTAAPQPPGQVTNLTAGAGGGSGEVSLQWDSVSGATQYRIYRSNTQGVSGSLIATSNTNSYTDTPGSHAYYQVSAVNAFGQEGQKSVEVCGAPVGDSC
jgi:hypothetical protein